MRGKRNAADKQTCCVMVPIDTMTQQGRVEIFLDYLRDKKAEPALLSALPSVLMKVPSQRVGFDEVTMTQTRSFLRQNAAEVCQCDDGARLQVFQALSSKFAIFGPCEEAPEDLKPLGQIYDATVALTLASHVQPNTSGPDRCQEQGCGFR
jgi:hypothetical protein